MPASPTRRVPWNLKFVPNVLSNIRALAPLSHVTKGSRILAGDFAKEQQFMGIMATKYSSQEIKSAMADKVLLSKEKQLLGMMVPSNQQFFRQKALSTMSTHDVLLDLKVSVFNPSPSLSKVKVGDIGYLCMVQLLPNHFELLIISLISQLSSNSHAIKVFFLIKTDQAVSPAAMHAPGFYPTVKPVHHQQPPRQTSHHREVSTNCTSLSGLPIKTTSQVQDLQVKLQKTSSLTKLQLFLLESVHLHLPHPPL